ncbi:Uncharacterised protein [Chlamydia trachomatis]|nr:Uncharacterised protein [Chlamydia trachomatis]
MVKYRDAIGAYWKVNNSKTVLNSPNISIVKSGIEAYEVGKGKPKQSKRDKDNRIYHSKTKIDNTYMPYIDGNNVGRYLISFSVDYFRNSK